MREVRREIALKARTSDHSLSKAIKGLRWTTFYLLENLPDKLHDNLAPLRPDQPLGRAYVLKEQLLEVLRVRRAHVVSDL